VLGSNPCNWAIIENRWGGEQDVKPGQMLTDMRTSGYGATDLGDLGFLPTQPDLTRGCLAGVQVMGAFVEMSLSISTLPDEEMSTLDKVCKIMSGFEGQTNPPHIVLADQGDSEIRQKNSGHISPALGMTSTEKERFLQNLALVRAHCQSYNVPVYFHPHCGSRVETVAEIEWLAGNSDVKLVFDTGHLLYASRGEADLVELLRKYKERIGTFHFKDINAEAMLSNQAAGKTYLEGVKRGDLVVNCGQGMVAPFFPDIVNWQRENGYKGFVCVEQETFDRSETAVNMAINQRYLTDLYQGPIPSVLIGSGRMGIIHGQNLSSSPHWDLRYVCDVKESTAKDAAKLLGASAVDNVKQAVKESQGEVKVAFICTPTPNHLEDIKACADLGLDIFIEKPVCVKESDIAEAYDYCEAKGVLLYCGFHRRFDPALRNFQKSVNSSSWGPCELLHVFGRDSPCPPVEFLKTSGGIFHDLMIHHIDQAQWCMGSPVTEAVALTNTWTPELANLDPPVLEETASVILKFRNGGMAMIDNTRRAPRYDERMEAFSIKGVQKFGFDPLDETTHHLTADPFVRFADGYRLEMDHLADLVRHKGIVPMEVTREQSISNSRIATQLMVSAEKKTVIQLK